MWVFRLVLSWLGLSHADFFHENGHKPCIFCFQNWSILPHPQANNPQYGPHTWLGRRSINMLPKTPAVSKSHWYFPLYCIAYEFSSFGFTQEGRLRLVWLCLLSRYLEVV